MLLIDYKTEVVSLLISIKKFMLDRYVGENSKSEDMGVNLVKGKQLTNMRKSGTDEAMKIAPKTDFSLRRMHGVYQSR